MKTIDNDIKRNEFKQVYLLYGKETYLINQYRRKLEKALMGDGDAMNFSSFEGTGVSVDDVMDIAETMPFFAERRVILLDHTGLFQLKKSKKPRDGKANNGEASGGSANNGSRLGNSEGSFGSEDSGAFSQAARGQSGRTGTGVSSEEESEEESEGAANARAAQLAEYMGHIPDTTYFIIVEEAVDKRSRLYKAAAKSGYAVEIQTPRADVLARWVGLRVRDEGKNITQGAYECLLERTGTDMETIDRELEKLLCYTMDRDVIREEDVRAIVTESTENRIFPMIDAIAEKRQKQALDMYYDLLSLKEAPMKILSLIERQFQTLFVVKAMSNQGFPNKEIAVKIGREKQEWTISKQYLPQCRKLPMESIKRAMRLGAEYEEAVKTGHLGDQLAVELFIVDICNGE